MNEGDIIKAVMFWAIVGQFALIFTLVNKGSTGGWEFEKYMAICMGPVGWGIILFLIIPVRIVSYLKSKFPVFIAWIKRKWKCWLVHQQQKELNKLND